MVEEQKIEQRVQAVKRLRSLFDMHNLSFGAPENLGGLLLSLRENRHFSMDFWSLVNTLSEDGSGAMSNEELLEAAVEGATGAGSSQLPEYERPGAHELRQMLAGVDTASPVTLPAPISSPVDALLPRQTFSTASAITSGSLSTEDALRTKRSIGEALSKLEQSTRELREQLAQIDSKIDSQSDSQTDSQLDSLTDSQTDAQMSFQPDEPADTAVPEPPATPSHTTEAQPAAPESRPIEAPLPQPQPPAEQQVETLARWNRVGSSSEPAATAAPIAAAPIEPPARVAPVAPAAPLPTPSPSERDVFARRNVQTFSQRGLAIPDPDDDPSIAIPLSGYAEEEPSSIGKWIAAVIVIAAVAAGGYVGARTDRGHALLSRAVDFTHSKYEALTGTAAPQQPAGPIAPEPQASQPAATEPAPANQPPATPQTEASTAPSSTTPASSPTPTAAPPATPQATTAQAAAHPPAAAPVPAATHPPHKAEATEPAAPVHPRPTGPIPDAGAVHVAGTAMASNLIVSRVPAYPEVAKEQEIEGSVIMEVLISPAGSVTYVRSIDGDRHLRAAAEDAVMRWRYKPYVVNGEPVQVATTVRVDFRLPR